MMAEKEDKAMDPTMDALKKKRMSITIMLGPDDDMEEMGEETLEKSMEEKIKKAQILLPKHQHLKRQMQRKRKKRFLSFLENLALVQWR